MLSVVDLDLVLAKLPELVTLEMNDVTLGPCLPGMLLLGWLHRRSLALLELRDVVMDSSFRRALLADPQTHKTLPEEPECALGDFLRLFTSIVTLHLFDSLVQVQRINRITDSESYGTYWDDRSLIGPVLSKFPRDICIQRVVADTCEIPSHADILILLAESDCLRGLQYLDICDQPSVVRTILRSIGGYLPTLRLDLRRAQDEDEAYEPVSTLHNDVV